MTRPGNVVVLCALAALVAGCSSDTDVATDTTSFIPTVPATTAPTTTPAPTTTTTAPPPTTTDPAATLAEQVEADLLEAFDLLNAGLQDPSDDRKRDAALDRFIGANREFVSARFEEFRSKGYAIRLGSAVEPVVRVEVGAQLIAPSTDLVRVQVCDVDSWVTVEVGGAPDGSDAIVDPTITSYRTVFFMRNVDGIWKVEGGEQIGEWAGAEDCLPA